MRDGLRKQLRTATEAVHAAAEHQVDLRAEIETPDGYERFLGVMRTVLRTFAEPLDTSSRLGQLEPRSRSLVAALDRDLTTTVPDLPAQSPTTYSAMYAIGVGYTLEGSAVGAGTLRRRVPEASPTHYLDALLDERRDRWTHYSRWLDRDLAPSPDEIGEAVQGASDVFRCVLSTIDLGDTTLTKAGT